MSNQQRWYASQNSAGSWNIQVGTEDYDHCVGVFHENTFIGSTGEVLKKHAMLAAGAPELFAELDVRVGDLVFLRKAIEAGDPKAELLMRVDDMLRETRAVIAKVEGAAEQEHSPVHRNIANRKISAEART